MITTTIKEIESQVLKNSKLKETQFKVFEKELKKRNFKSGRIRPKNPTEAKILASFSRK